MKKLSDKIIAFNGSMLSLKEQKLFFNFYIV
jgi:hypothetical protein